MMNLLDIFDGSKPFKRIQVPLTSHRMQNPMDMSDLDRHLNTSVSSIATGGTDYVEDYVKEEDTRVLAVNISIPTLIARLHHRGLFSLLQEANPMTLLQGKLGDNFEEVSQGTSLPVHHELQNEELTKIYKTYNFAYRPKENLTITSLELKIVSMVRTNRTVVIHGPTGCGKTTQVPQFILDSCCKKREHCNIIGKSELRAQILFNLSKPNRFVHGPTRSVLIIDYSNNKYEIKLLWFFENDGWR